MPEDQPYWLAALNGIELEIMCRAVLAANCLSPRFSKMVVRIASMLTICSYAAVLKLHLPIGYGTNSKANLPECASRTTIVSHLTLITELAQLSFAPPPQPKLCDTSIGESQKEHNQPEHLLVPQQTVPAQQQ